MKMFKTLFLSMLITIPMLTLSGCGTLQRDNSYETTYRGFDSDKKIVSNPYAWMFSLGIVPVIGVISMPFDLVIDTVLLPWDLNAKARKDQESKTTSSKVTATQQ